MQVQPEYSNSLACGRMFLKPHPIFIIIRRIMSLEFGCMWPTIAKWMYIHVHAMYKHNYIVNFKGLESVLTPICMAMFRQMLSVV